MKTLISIDGGMSSGISVGTYSDTEPYRLTHSFQFGGGVVGFIENVRHYHDTDDFSDGGTCFSVESQSGNWNDGYCLWWDVLGQEGTEPPVFIAEKFTARGGGQGFALRTEHMEPLRIEGAMLAMGLDPIWVSPPQQYFSGGSSKAEKKKAQHRWLKEKGLYVTGKMVDSPDADDVRSSIAHAIAYLVRQKHMPTIRHYFPKEEK